MSLYYTKSQLENSPSRRDGLDPEKERDFRKTYSRFICSMGKELKLSAWTLETACVLAHRFFAQRSMVKNDRFLVATAALHLASKIDESPRQLFEIACVYQRKKLAGKPAELKKLHTDKKTLEKLLEPHMEHIMLAERALLYTLGFEFQVDHPLNVIVKGMQKLGMLSNESKDALGQKLTQLAVNFCNDSMGTTLLIEYPAKKVGHAAIYNAATALGASLPLPEGQTFCSFFDITQREIEDIAQQFMTQYVVAKKGPEDKPVTALTPVCQDAKAVQLPSPALGGQAQLPQPALHSQAPPRTSHPQAPAQVTSRPKPPQLGLLNHLPPPPQYSDAKNAPLAVKPAPRAVSGMKASAPAKRGLDAEAEFWPCKRVQSVSSDMEDGECPTSHPVKAGGPWGGQAPESDSCASSESLALAMSQDADQEVSARRFA